MDFDIDAAIDSAVRRLQRRASEDERQKRLAQQKRELLQGVRELRRMSGQLKSALELVTETETNSCGLYAAKECWRRFKENFPCGVLRFEFPKGHEFAGHAHAVCCYELPEKTMLVYEPGRGSSNVGRVGWDASAVAQAFCKGATHAKWVARP
jgi:hypothetical protein